MTAVLTPDVTRAEGTPHVLAFYLPQFHPVPENDAWHAPGFTEWDVVVRSRPKFAGHGQPEFPGELGFYDLRVPETRIRQAALARAHGVTGFLYYHYWFSGRRVLDRPLREVLESGKPDFPFALCWVNESWFRRWQDARDMLILEQNFSEDDDLDHIRWMIECFKDPRYIRIGGRPLLALYRAHHLPNPARTAEVWRRECAQAGVEEPWLVMFETGEMDDDPTAIGFDASAEFVPHLLHKLTQPSSFGEPQNGHHTYVGFDYDDVASAYLDRPTVPWVRYPCVATGWDNTPRRQATEALIVRDSTPERFGRWLAAATERQQHAAGRDGIVFVNAWNEWAEGAHLEPDAHWGRAYLEAARDVLGVPEEIDIPSPGNEDTSHASIEELYEDLYRRFVDLQRSSSGYLSYADRRLVRVRRDYEEQLATARDDLRTVAELNQAMADEVRLLTERLRELGESDVPAPSWLAPLIGPPQGRRTT
jgi:hypothetical protein